MFAFLGLGLANFLHVIIILQVDGLSETAWEHWLLGKKSTRCNSYHRTTVRIRLSDTNCLLRGCISSDNSLPIQHPKVLGTGFLLALSLRCFVPFTNPAALHSLTAPLDCGREVLLYFYNSWESHQKDFMCCLK